MEDCFHSTDHVDLDIRDSFAGSDDSGYFSPKMSHQREDVNDILDNVIGKVNRISEHLRQAGENEAANRFARDMTTTFRELYNVIAPWDIDKCLMKASNELGVATKAPTSPPYQSTTTPISNTWASIAATEPITNSNGIVKFRPSDSLKTTVGERTLIREEESGRDSKDRRVVWVTPWPATRSLNDIADRISNLGAVYSIAWASEDEGACIVFQHAWCAVEFTHNCAEHISRTGISPFGPSHHVFSGHLFTPESIDRMNPPYNERRRLTFARSQLFSSGITEERFRKDIEHVCGAQNILLLWLFNTGNATVVFSAVPLAKMVRETFLKYSRIRKHPYEGITVTFSHDPCERDMNLVSQIPGHANYIGGNGNGSSGYGNGYPKGRQGRSGTLSTNASSPSRRYSTTSQDAYSYASRRRGTTSKSSQDEDGWQTVGKRR